MFKQSSVMLGCLGLLSCGGAEKATTDLPMARLRVGVIPVAEAAILLDSATFRKHGIELDMQSFPSGAQISDGVIGGGLTFGYSNLVTPLIAASRGIQLRVIGPISVENDQRARHGLVVKQSGPISSPSSLKGHTVAINSLQNIDHLMLSRWLTDQGLRFADVEVQITRFPDMLAAVRSGAVDAAALVEPFITQAKQAGDFRVMGNYFASSSGSPTAVSGFVAMEGWLTDNPGIAERLIAALNEAVAKAASDPTFFRQLVIAITKSDSAVVSAMPLPWYQSTDIATMFEDLSSVAKRFAFISDTVNASSVLYHGGR